MNETENKNIYYAEDRGFPLSQLRQQIIDTFLRDVIFKGNFSDYTKEKETVRHAKALLEYELSVVRRVEE
jgi:hypothetical protein